MQHRVLAAAARPVGIGLGVALSVVARLRRDKGLHAFGVTTSGQLVVSGGFRSGVELVDDAARHEVEVRLSRAASFAAWAPDVMGIALRIPGAASGGRPADLLFATTGSGAITRFVLVPHLALGRGCHTTLLPMRTPAGRPIWFRLDPIGYDGARFTFSVAVGDGRWSHCGHLVLDGRPAGDLPLRFHPTRDLPRGLTLPRWVVALRDPAYTTFRPTSADLRLGDDHADALHP